ncbi:hypothetical protein O3M35_007567 [Rhynocoris fuscipes]|uniref:60S acidic ribosomal protein P2 n=1 Tax=Rhynocoris fuscipes TaxID=488301 RepID=A0AAW1DA29_9HEMI
MRYVVAYLVAVLGGKDQPSLERKNIEDVIAKGKETLASVPAEGGAAVPEAASSAPAAASATKAVEEKKKPEKE